MKSKITLVILIVIIIFLTALSFFFGYKYFDGKKQIGHLNETVETLSKVSEQNKENTTNNNATEVIEKRVIAKYDYSKIANTIPNKNYNVGIRAYSQNGKLILQDNYATYNDNVRYSLDSKIVDGLESNIVIGGGITRKVCLVTENGELYVATTNEQEIHKVDSLSNICRLYTIGGEINQSIIAVDIDGNCYDLSAINNL